MHEEREKLLERGFDGLLLKPFKEAELLQAIGVQVKPGHKAKDDAAKRIDGTVEENDLVDLENKAAHFS